MYLCIFIYLYLFIWTDIIWIFFTISLFALFYFLVFLKGRRAALKFYFLLIIILIFLHLFIFPRDRRTFALKCISSSSHYIRLYNIILHCFHTATDISSVFWWRDQLRISFLTGFLFSKQTGVRSGRKWRGNGEERQTRRFHLKERDKLVLH